MEPNVGLSFVPTLNNSVVYSVAKTNHDRCCRFHKPVVSLLRDLPRVLVACCIIYLASGGPDILLLTHARLTNTSDAGRGATVAVGSPLLREAGRQMALSSAALD